TQFVIYLLTNMVLLAGYIFRLLKRIAGGNREYPRQWITRHLLMQVGRGRSMLFLHNRLSFCCCRFLICCCWLLFLGLLCLVFAFLFRGQEHLDSLLWTHGNARDILAHLVEFFHGQFG